MSNQSTSTKPVEKVNQVRPRPIGGDVGFEERDTLENYSQVPSSFEAFEQKVTPVPNYVKSVSFGDQIVKGTIPLNDFSAPEIHSDKIVGDRSSFTAGDWITIAAPAKEIVGEKIQDAGKAVLEGTGQVALDSLDVILDTVKLVSGLGLKNEKSGPEKDPDKQAKIIEQRFTREQHAQTDAKVMEISQENFMKYVAQVGGDKVATMAADEQNVRLHRNASLRQSLSKNDVIELAKSVAEDEEKMEEIQEQQEEQQVQRIAGADQKRNFEDQNMNNPG